jgi:hypothetical protein
MRFNHPDPDQRSRSLAVQLSLALGAIAMLTLLGACGGDDDDAAGEGTTRSDPAGGTASTARTTTSTMQPRASGEDLQPAFALVEQLVLDATSLTDRLLQDPTLASEEGSAELEQLEQLYTSDSPTPAQVEARIAELVSRGERVRPAGSGVFREFMVHDMAAVDANTVRFNFCANQDQETADAAGEVVDRFAEVSQGAGEARYADGRWRFYGLHRDDATSLPTEPGNALVGFCQTLYGGGGQE